MQNAFKMPVSNALVNADRLKLAIMHSTQLPWMQSPEQGVERRMLERIGDEVALATSIVRYHPGAKFSSHTHDLGEEFFVLEGTIADEQGEYPAGTYVRNPPGSSHAPFSNEGCTIFVKLRQMARDNTDHVKLLSDQYQWHSIDDGIERAMLYAKQSMTVELLRMETGYKLSAREYPDGEELFVIYGTVLWCGEPQANLNQWSWLRNPGSLHHDLISQSDSLLWVKRGHLSPVENNG